MLIEMRKLPTCIFQEKLPIDRQGSREKVETQSNGKESQAPATVEEESLLIGRKKGETAQEAKQRGTKERGRGE